MIKCQVCGYDNPNDANVCLNCGSPIEKPKVSEAIDDISGEATVLIGMPKMGAAPPKPAAPAAAAPPPVRPAAPAPIAAPKPAPVKSAPTPAPKPVPPPPTPVGGLNMTYVIVAGAVVISLLLVVVIILLATR